MSKSFAVRAALAPAALVYGLGAEVVAAHHGQTTTYAGASAGMTALELLTGWALIAAGLMTWHVRPALLVGPLTIAAGFVWFAPDWVGWEGGPAPVRSVGMLVAGSWLALLVHAALVFPHGRLSSVAARVLVTATYTATAIVGVGRALFRNPYDIVDCWDNCTANIFLIRSDAGVAHALDWIDLRFAIVVVIAFVAVSSWRFASVSRPARRVLAPVLGAGAIVASINGAHAVALLHMPLEDPRRAPFTILFIAQCLALSSFAAALGWDLARARRARRAVERFVVELEQAPEPGSVEAALAGATGDSSLRIAYQLHDERCVDSRGRPVLPPSASSTRAVTSIVRNGRPIALLEHDPNLPAHSLPDYIGSAGRLAVENERLQAEALAQLIELRESRSRMVEASDVVRRQLERDLHDGAQQRLVALSFALRLARAELEEEPHRIVADALADADRALGHALAAVRAVANGLFPATLASSGLAYAVEELIELAPIRIDLEGLPDRRLPTAVEAAAYGVIREAIENAALHAQANAISISAVCDEKSVVVDAMDDGIGGADPNEGVGLLDVSDRVGALGGTLTLFSPPGHGTRLHAEIPCA